VNGSAAFAEDHPDVGEGIQFGFNQDNGTWRIEAIRMQAFDYAEPQVKRWLDRLPPEIGNVPFTSPDFEGGSDHSSFTCRGQPVVRLQANYPDYRQYTWHTNLDTFDKVIIDDLKNNATLAAMLAYQAAADPERLNRRRDRLPPDSRGVVPERAVCGVPLRHAP
jgi:carboxypeptidase Q